MLTPLSTLSNPPPIARFSPDHKPFMEKKLAKDRRRAYIQKMAALVHFQTKAQESGLSVADLLAKAAARANPSNPSNPVASTVVSHAKSSTAKKGCRSCRG